eukprot:GHVR01117666.1.p1 GENE.GHVR01117666.1~~GHVR01117666.1.p1  ORF type:complete len:102 (+),score=9.43 GHVR01117666.1:165-470(+)
MNIYIYVLIIQFTNCANLEVVLKRALFVSMQQGMTVLMYAANSQSDNVNVIRYLIEKGAYVNARDLGGRSALGWANHNALGGAYCHHNVNAKVLKEAGGIL